MPLYWNPSDKDWQREPYMVKEYSVLSPCGQYLATVVVIPMGEVKTLVRGPNAGKEKESTSFIPMGVRIEHVKGRKSEDSGYYNLPGKAWFLKRKTNTLTETKPFQFMYHWGKLQVQNYRPALKKPAKESTDESSVQFERSIYYKQFAALVKGAWECYEAHRAAKRAAA